MNTIILVVITTISMCILLWLGVQPFVAWGSIFIVIMAVNVWVSVIRQKKRLYMFEEACDPEAFINRTEKQIKIFKRYKKQVTYLSIDKVAGLMTWGRYKEAKELLLSLDKNMLSDKNLSLFIYNMNMLGCYHFFGESEEAEELFTKLIGMVPVNSKIPYLSELLLAERLLYLKKYDEGREYFIKLKDQKLSKRLRLEVINSLAKIDEENGNIDAALEGYKQVAEQGNKLWIAEKAREKCKLLA